MGTKIIKSIVGICGIILYNFIFPVMVLLLIFLGSIQAIYHVESNFSTGINQSFVIASEAMNKGVVSFTDMVTSVIITIYNTGSNNSNWFYYFFIILIALFSLTIYRIYFEIKKIRGGAGDDNTAQGIIDSIEVKGGNEK